MTWPLFVESALTSANEYDWEESPLQTASNYFTIVIASLSTAEQVKWLLLIIHNRRQRHSINTLLNLIV